MNHDAMIKKLNQYANKNYTNNGWDYWVEAYTHSEKLELIEGFTKYNEAFLHVEYVMKLLKNRCDEVQDY